MEALKDNKPLNINTFNVNKIFKKESLTDTCIIQSAKNLGSTLKTFDLSNSPISDDSLQAIAKFCPKATTIILSGWLHNSEYPLDCILWQQLFLCRL